MKEVEKKKQRESLKRLKKKAYVVHAREVSSSGYTVYMCFDCVLLRDLHNCIYV